MAKTNKGRKFFATTATAALVASAIVPVASAAQVNDFNSIATYAQDAVQNLVDRGVVEGDANGNFQPRKSVSRAEAATVLSKALGLTTTEAIYFTDVKSGAWYYDAINAAVNNGVFSGKGEGKFDPNGNLTRGEAAVILVNSFGLEGAAPLAQFADEKSVKAWAKEALEIAVGNGVIKGDNGKIKANDAITKQDFAVMFARSEEAADLVAASTVKAINATTVEVTFADSITDIKALDFAIEGLEVKNAVVKQTDAKTAVLTTAAQTAGTEYNVTVNGESVGKFTGVSAVVPTTIKLVETSVQGSLGKEVTVKAQVTVAEGQSKAGIPVTFNVPSVNTLSTALTFEGVTDADGVATYTYTRYQAIEDSVVAYATGDRSKFSTGVVYWGVAQQLTLTEVTEGATVKNGSNKTYKVKVLNTDGTPKRGEVVQVGLQENIGTALNALSTAKVNGSTPYQAPNGTVTNPVSVTTDSNGEAVFTVSGTNTSATPVVFINKAQTTTSASGVTTTTVSPAYTATALQVKAAKVTFGALQLDYKLAISSELPKEVASGDFNGRDFKVTVTDKDGKAVANEIVKIAIHEEYDSALNTSSAATLVEYNEAGTLVTGRPTLMSVKTNAKGEAEFTMIGANATYGTPIAWIDINSADANSSNKLEDGEPSVIGETTFFTAPKLVSSKLVTVDAITGKSKEKFTSNQVAQFDFDLTNQSGKSFTNYATAGVSSVAAEFNVTNTGSYDAYVFTTLGAAQAYLSTGLPTGGQLVSPNRDVDVAVSSATAASVYVVSVSDTKATSVKVTASAVATKTDSSKVSLVVTDSATAAFTPTSAVADLETKVVKSFDTANQTITLDGKTPIKYAGVTGVNFKYKGIGNTPIATAADFIKELREAGGAVTVTYEVTADATTFYIVSVGTTPADAPVDTVVTTDTSLTSVVVDGTPATATGTTYNVILPVGKTAAALTAADVVATAPNGTVSTPATADAGKTWTFNVVSGDTTVTTAYTVNVIEQTGFAYTDIVGTNGTAITTATPAISGLPAGATVTFAAAGLPTGLSIAPTTGVITGTVSSVVATTPVVVTATYTDAAGATQTLTSTVNVTINPFLVAAPVVAYAAISGTANTAITTPVAPTLGNATPVTGYAVKAGSTLPAGLTLDPSNGEISGTLPAAGSYTFTIAASYSDNGVTKTVDVIVSVTTTP